MDGGFLEPFMSNMGVKEGCPFYPTLFGPCIDKLEEKKKDWMAQKLMHERLICLFSYTSDDTFT